VETVDRAAQFLIGSCSCQVKEQNPGVDLVMAVDWKKMVKDQAMPGQQLPELSEIADLLPQTVKIGEETKSEPVKHDPWLMVFSGAGAVLVLALLKRFWTRRG
jgi:hypothetical protein